LQHEEPTGLVGGNVRMWFNGRSRRSHVDGCARVAASLAGDVDQSRGHRQCVTVDVCAAAIRPMGAGGMPP
jgi:hypothetical protein